MKLSVLAIIAVIVLKCEAWASGYFVDPALLSIFTPFIVLPLFLIPFIAVVYYGVKLFKSKENNSKKWGNFFAATIATGVLFIPGIPDSYDGFQTRMSNYSAEEFYALAKEIKSTHTTSKVEFLSGKKLDGSLVAHLAKEHRILNSGVFAPTVLRNKKYISIYWGGGLTGAFEIVISARKLDETWLKNWRPEPRYLYDRVILLLK